MADFSHRHACFNHPMSMRAIDLICPQAILPTRVTRGAELELESVSKSPGVVAASQESKSGLKLIKVASTPTPERFA